MPMCLGYCGAIYIHTHPFNGPFPGLPRSAGTRKVKPIWILLKQETVSGSGISWAIGKSAPCSRQITMPAPHHSVFTGWMPFQSPNQQRQSGAIYKNNIQGLGVLQQYSSVRGDQGVVWFVLVFSRSTAVWLHFCDIVNVFCPRES